MTPLKIGAGVLVAGLLLIQLVPVSRTNPPVLSEIDVPPAVKAVLERSCYDCHSHKTRWPWYAYVAPASWLVTRHVEEGREEMNLSRWDEYDAKRQAHLMKEMIEEIEDGEMPESKYLILHRDARVTRSELELLRDWVGAPPGNGTYRSDEGSDRGEDEDSSD